MGTLSPAEYPQEAELAFRFRLARDLKMTVEELLDRVCAFEFMQWAEFYAAEVRAQKRAQEKAEKAAAAARRRRNRR